MTTGKKARVVVEVLENPMLPVPDKLLAEGWQPVRLVYIDRLHDDKIYAVPLFIPPALEPSVLERVVNDAVDPAAFMEPRRDDRGGQFDELDWKGAEKL